MFQSFCIISEDASNLTGYLEKIISERKTHSSDVLQLTEETVGISDVRTVITFATRKPFASEYKIVSINADGLTPEAQQALLKILEEPPASTLFFLTMTSEEKMLPTILSRCVIKYLDTKPQQTDEKNEQIAILWKNMLAQGIGRRLLDAPTIAADRQALAQWLEEQAHFFRNELQKNYNQNPTDFTILQSYRILRLLQQAFIYTQMNVSLKLIIDDLLLQMPHIAKA